MFTGWGCWPHAQLVCLLWRSVCCCLSASGFGLPCHWGWWWMLDVKMSASPKAFGDGLFRAYTSSARSRVSSVCIFEICSHFAVMVSAVQWCLCRLTLRDFLVSQRTRDQVLPTTDQLLTKYTNKKWYDKLRDIVVFRFSRILVFVCRIVGLLRGGYWLSNLVSCDCIGMNRVCHCTVTLLTSPATKS